MHSSTLIVDHCGGFPHVECLILFKVSMEDSLHLSHALTMEDGPMPARNDQLAFGVVQMAAPVGYDAVVAHRLGAVEVASLTPVTDDGVVGDSRLRCECIYCLQKGVSWVENVDAVW